MIGLVPARGGSQGVLRKNLQTINGRPLFLNAAHTLRDAGCDPVIVSSDDDTILSLARLHGFVPHVRKEVSADQTVAEAARLVWQWFVGSKGSDNDLSEGLLVLQPTVPLTVEQVSGFVENAELVKPPGAKARFGVTRHRHMMWDAGGERITEWVNRQGDGGWPWQGVGVYWWPADRVGELGGGLAFDVGDVVDVDTVADLHAARLEAERRRIHIWFTANKLVGSGHVRRAVALADALQHHDVYLIPDHYTEPEWTTWALEQGHQQTVEGVAPDLAVTDFLDARIFPRDLPLWVSIENRGPDAHKADLLINALYPHRGWSNERYGADWAILRPEFTAMPPYEVREQVERVLVLFGGTDPSHLTAKATEAFPTTFELTVVRPGENRPIAELMHTHDLLLTSAGRTVFEAAAVGIPTIVMAQNARETTHTHLGLEHGNLFLGLGRTTSVSTLRDTVYEVAGDAVLRREMSQRSQVSIDGKGLERVVNAIDCLLKGL